MAAPTSSALSLLGSLAVPIICFGLIFLLFIIFFLWVLKLIIAGLGQKKLIRSLLQELHSELGGELTGDTHDQNLKMKLKGTYKGLGFSVEEDEVE